MIFDVFKTKTMMERGQVRQKGMMGKGSSDCQRELSKRNKNQFRVGSPPLRRTINVHG